MRLTAFHDRHDLEGGACSPPMQDPLLDEAKLVALHELKAAGEVRLDPAGDVLQPLGQTSSSIPNALVDRQHVVAFETLDDHEEHITLRSR